MMANKSGYVPLKLTPETPARERENQNQNAQSGTYDTSLPHKVLPESSQVGSMSSMPFPEGLVC
jgi:hypothetical protein